MKMNAQTAEDCRGVYVGMVNAAWERSRMDISPIIGDLAMGGFAGYSVGYFSKKFLKLVAFVMGGYIASLLYFSSRGYLIVNWDKIGISADGVFSKISVLGASVGVMGAGAIGGFVLGWRSG